MGRSITLILGHLEVPASLFDYLDSIGLKYGYYLDEKLSFQISVQSDPSSNYLYSIQLYQDLIEKTEDQEKKNDYIKWQSQARNEYCIVASKLGTQPAFYFTVPIFCIDKFENDPEAQLQRMNPLIEAIGKISTKWPCVIHNEGGEIYTHEDIVKLHEQKIDFVFSTTRM